MNQKIIKIGNGQGFWGDSIDAPINLVQKGHIDYLTLDYLAEVTLSIMQRQKLKNPKNLEYITNIFYGQRTKMIKKNLNFLFNNSHEISKK